MVSQPWISAATIGKGKYAKSAGDIRFAPMGNGGASVACARVQGKAAHACLRLVLLIRSLLFSTLDSRCLIFGDIGDWRMQCLDVMDSKRCYLRSVGPEALVSGPVLFGLLVMLAQTPGSNLTLGSAREPQIKQSPQE